MSKILCKKRTFNFNSGLPRMLLYRIYFSVHEKFMQVVLEYVEVTSLKVISTHHLQIINSNFPETIANNYSKY